MDSICLKIDSRADQVALVGRCIRVLSAALVAERAACEIELATCEVINNVIEHAYGGAPGRDIVIEWSHRDEGLIIEVHDWGRAVPAERLLAGLPDVNLSDVPNLPEGGFGIGLLNALSDRVDYRSDDDGRNTLRLFRRLRAPHGDPEA